MDQRFKATNQAYWSIITLTAKNGNVSLEKAAPASHGLTHAGGVVFRKRWWRVQYLLVEAKDDPHQWVLPKGHVEETEHSRETAVREVHEETGVWARIVHDLDDVSYSVNGTVVTVRFYLMQAVGRGSRQDPHRQHLWLPLQQAIARASHLETRELLQAAEQRRSSRASEASAPATHKALS
jgi:8-oxo-dGTP pyrophosphatase MutT (NUDIX family)